MDRKYCALLYSKYSPSSKSLMTYLKNLPIDFPTVVGLAMVNIDSLEIKNIIQQNGIEYVPTILIEYFNGNKQKLDNEYIYKWIHQIMETLGYNQNKHDNESPQTALIDNYIPQSINSEKPSIQENFQKQTPIEIKSKEINSIASQLQQSREEDFKKFTINNRPI